MLTPPLEEILSNSAVKLREQLLIPEIEVFDEIYTKVLSEFRADIKLAQAENKLAKSSALQIRQLKLSDLSESKEEILETIVGEEVNYTSFEYSDPPEGEKLVSVFMPVKNGRGKILRSLFGLKKELDALDKNGFEYIINICINNTQDGTLERVLKFKQLFPQAPLNIYELDKESLRATGKIYSLNLLYTLLKNNISSGENVYIHVADDDIGYPKPTSGILSNIQELQNNDSLKAICGTYTTSKSTEGFHFLNSIRKDRGILAKVGPLPQVYGGALTINFQDFPAEGLPPDTSFDCFITLYYLKDKITNIGALIENPEDLPIRTNPEFLIEHPEEPAFAKFVWRFLRDVDWRKKSAEQLGGDKLETEFLKLRRTLYDKITQTIEELPNTDPRKIGQKWLRLIRDEVYSQRDSGELTRELVVPLLQDGSSADEQAFCHSLIKDIPRFNSTLELLAQNSYFDTNSLTELSKPELTEKVKFKHIERAINKNKDHLRENNWLGDPTIYLLDSIIERTLSQRELLCKETTLRAIFERADINLGKDINIERHEALGNCNFSFFIESDGQKYFLRYHDPLGFRWFQRHTPRKTTYFSVLCEEIFGELLGKEAVIGTIFPSLETAADNYFGLEETNPIEKIAQRVLIQKDIRKDYTELINYCELGLDLHQATEIYASILAEYHGKSLGITKYFRNSEHSDKKFMKLLNLAGEDIRFSNAASYQTWLCGPNWVTRIFNSLEDEFHRDNQFYHCVKSMLNEADVDISNKFSEVCTRSVKRFEEGSLGHLDFKLNNLFVNQNNTLDRKIYDFDHITFLDPMYEAGHSIYSLVKHALLAENANANELLELTETFNNTYYSQFQHQLEIGNFAGKKQIITSANLLADSNFFAGITLLSVFASEYKNYNLSPGQLESIKQVCYALLKQ